MAEDKKKSGIDIVFVAHQRDQSPGDRVTVKDEDAEVARTKVRGGAAVYATKTDAERAGEPDGPTVRDPEPAEA